MTEQPIPPTPRLGRGGRWSGHPDIDGPVPPAEPYRPPPRTRPAAGWPKTGNLGASTTDLVADEEPVTVPGRPYVVTRHPMVADPARTAAQAATFRTVDDAVRHSLTAHAAEVTRRAVEAGWLPAAPSVAPRSSRLARAIGWFRR